MSNNQNFELCCKQKKNKNRKIDKQADINIDTNKYFPLEEDN